MNAQSLISALNTKEGRHIGDLVIYAFAGSQDYVDTVQRRNEAGLENAIKLRQVSAVNAIKRAVSAVAGRGELDSREWSVEKVAQSNTRIAWQFVGKELVDSDETGVADKAVRFSHEIGVAFDNEAYREGNVPAEGLVKAQDWGHPIVNEVYRQYLRKMSEVKAEDLNRATVAAFEGWHGIPLRSTGGVWLLPAGSSAEVRQWQEWAEPYGQAMVIPVHDSEEALQSMRKAAENDIMHTIEETKKKLDELVGKSNTRMSTIEAQLEALDHLRDKTETYERLLECTLEGLRGKLKDAEQSFYEKVMDMSEST